MILMMVFLVLLASGLSVIVTQRLIFYVVFVREYPPGRFDQESMFYLKG